MIYVAGFVVVALLLGLRFVVRDTRSGLALLRGQIRDDYQTDAFRDAVAKAMDSHSVTAPIEKIVERSVERATSSSFGALTTSIGAIATEQRAQAVRISSCETKVEGLLARSQAQRRSDLPGAPT
jgi:HAMP domain-containing protein